MLPPRSIARHLPTNTRTLTRLSLLTTPNPHLIARMSNFAYPEARRSDHVDTWKSASRGEVKIADPYEWLEQPPSESKETSAWVDAQVEFASKHLRSEESPRYREKLEKVWNYAKFSAPSLKKDGNYYFSYNTGLQNQYTMHRFPKSDLEKYKDIDGASAELFFDPNLLSEDGTISLSASSFSESGKLWAYGLAKSGSDWFTIHVRKTTGKFENVNDSNKLEDVVEFAKFTGVTWDKDDKGFFYQRFPSVTTDTEGDSLGTATASDKDAQLFYHRLGTPQSSDILVHSNPSEPSHIFSYDHTDDHRYALLYTSRDTSQSSLLSIAEIPDDVGPNGEGWGKLQWKEVIKEWGAVHYVILNDGPKFTVRTNKDAPRYKVQTFDVSAEEIVFTDIIEEDEKAVLGNVAAIRDDLLFVNYSRDVNDEFYLYTKAGKQIKRLAPNFVGSMSGLRGEREHDRLFVSTTGYTNPGLVYTLDLSEGKDPKEQDLDFLRETKLDLKSEDFITVQEFYESKDGTRIPMSITRHKSVKLDGSAPAILYGYGGFNISMEPRFSPSWMAWVATYHGVLAVPNLRGGGEYGETWHEDGIKEKKQNSYDDMIFAAEHLISKGYTSAGKIILNGGSNGGLMVGAVINQAREGLIGAAIADVGVMDLLKFHKWTIGYMWASDFGNPDDPKDFDFIEKISPLHNIDSKRIYPPTLITTADHDDRVVPAHSFKYAAEMQYRLKDAKNPVLIRIDVKAGHGGGKPTAKIIDEAVDKWGWGSRQIGLKMLE